MTPGLSALLCGGTTNAMALLPGLNAPHSSTHCQVHSLHSLYSSWASMRTQAPKCSGTVRTHCCGKLGEVHATHSACHAPALPGAVTSRPSGANKRPQRAAPASARAASHMKLCFMYPHVWHGERAWKARGAPALLHHNHLGRRGSLHLAAPPLVYPIRIVQSKCDLLRGHKHTPAASPCKSFVERAAASAAGPSAGARCSSM